MKLDKNYHTHMKYCNHATGDVADYIKKANDLGMSTIGMSDHAPIPPNCMNEEEWTHNYCNENMTLEIFDKYLKEIEDEQEKYPNLKIYKALESEYLEGYYDWYESLRERIDYMILGVHFFNDTESNKIYDTYQDINYDTVDKYYINMEKAVKTGLFDYLAHPDLYLFDYKDKNGQNIFDEKCEEIANKIFKLAIDFDLPVEINANGIKYSKIVDGKKVWRYPNKEFWKISKNYPELKIIIGADCHTPELLDSDFINEVINMTKELDIKVIDEFNIVKKK